MYIYFSCVSCIVHFALDSKGIYTRLLAWGFVNDSRVKQAWIYLWFVHLWTEILVHPCLIPAGLFLPFSPLGPFPLSRCLGTQLPKESGDALWWFTSSPLDDFSEIFLKLFLPFCHRESSLSQVNFFAVFFYYPLTSWRLSGSSNGSFHFA